MVERQLSFAEALMHPRLGASARLEAVDAAIDWSALERVVDKAAPPSEVGRPRYAPLPLLKAIYFRRSKTFPVAGHMLSRSSPSSRGLRRFALPGGPSRKTSALPSASKASRRCDARKPTIADSHPENSST
jgi:hypothetical protein